MTAEEISDALEEATYHTEPEGEDIHKLARCIEALLEQVKVLSKTALMTDEDITAGLEMQIRNFLK